MLTENYSSFPKHAKLSSFSHSATWNTFPLHFTWLTSISLGSSLSFPPELFIDVGWFLSFFEEYHIYFLNRAVVSPLIIGQLSASSFYYNFIEEGSRNRMFQKS
jgi:hypothetical protein